ncbi:hypothetical protein [Enterococcus wangshanyuanii]|uniref:Uncharacterized protein n=1 Tax=Enterococcus wangshanyuanii TaxID=2005703 RepID=A0ABQ1PXW7_9ENTE|nr:hypothetical protein [Enterococcus wangshanyuanii]GGD06222.1 hypothetical protein GCM10011573_39550 [Enterococcus wangshanyuanii]
MFKIKINPEKFALACVASFQNDNSSFTSGDVIDDKLSHYQNAYSAALKHNKRESVKLDDSLKQLDEEPFSY